MKYSLSPREIPRAKPKGFPTWQVSGIRCQVSKKKMEKVVELVGGGSVIYGAYPV